MTPEHRVRDRDTCSVAWHQQIDEVVDHDRHLGSDLDDWIAAAAKRHGFVATDHRIEIVGLCPDGR